MTFVIFHSLYEAKVISKELELGKRMIPNSVRRVRLMVTRKIIPQNETKRYLTQALKKLY